MFFIKKKKKRPADSPELKALKAKARKVFSARAAYYAQVLGVSYNRIAIRCQKTRWGSCSSKKNLNFNCLLLYAPEEVLDYVVIHELAHLRYMNHSKDFYALVASICPDYKACQKWLREHGGELMRRKDIL